MKGKCRPGRRRLRARGRPGHYEEELVARLLRREERCDVRENEGNAAIEAALSREMWQNRTREREGEKDETKRKVDESATHLWGLRAFPLKNNAPHNRERDVPPSAAREIEYTLYYFSRSRDTLEYIAPPKVIIQKKRMHLAPIANMEPTSGTRRSTDGRENRGCRREEETVVGRIARGSVEVIEGWRAEGGKQKGAIEISRAIDR